MFEQIIASIQGANPLSYTLLLLAAGCGLPMSEDLLNVWVGGLIGRGQATYPVAFYVGALFIGVLGSDMLTFFWGRLARLAFTDRVKRKILRDPKKYELAERRIQRYGNTIGFVQRFSLGARVPLTFMSGFTGVPAGPFFTGVFFGTLLTLPLQLFIGYIMRNQIEKALHEIQQYGMWIAIVIVAAVALFFYRLWRRI